MRNISRHPASTVSFRTRVLDATLPAALAAFIFFSLMALPVVTDNVLNGFDFPAFYGAGKIVQEGFRKELYNAELQKEVQQQFTTREKPLLFYHPAFESLLFVPLAFWPLLTAYRIWAFINLLLISISAYLMRNYLRNVRRFSFRVALVLSSFLPMFVAILQGQDSALLLVLFVLAFVSLKQDREFRAGCFLALGLFKLQLVLPYMLPFMLKRKWKNVMGFLTGSVLLGLISLWVAGWEGLKKWLDLLRHENQNLAYAASQQANAIFPAAMPNLRGLLYAALGHRLAENYLNLVIFFCSGILIVWATTKLNSNHESDRRPFDLQFSLNLIVALLVSYHLNLHDLSLLSLPVLLLLNHWDMTGCTTPRRVGFLGTIVVLFLIPSYLIVTGNRHFCLLAWVMLLLAFIISAEITDVINRETTAETNQGCPG